MRIITYMTLSLAALPLSWANAAQNQQSDSEKGAYIFDLAGCASCHTKDKPLAGGLAMETDFGVFYTPNISPDKEFGIGSWSQTDFNRALREGVSPAGEHYFPAFPYTSYRWMSDEDLRVLKVYIDNQQAVKIANQKHDLAFPFNQRGLMGYWKWLFVDPMPVPGSDSQDPQIQRGAYIANALTHCAECHTPRSLLGGQRTIGMIGTTNGPEGESVPGLVGPKASFAQWSKDDIATLLELGMTPEGDFVGGSMSHVIDNSTAKLTPEDNQALTAYLYQLNN